MVTEWLLQLAVWLGTMVLDMMPDSDAAALVDDGSTVVASVIQMGHGITVWFPWAVVGLCAATTFTAWGALFVLKILRQLLAHVPQFGGTG